MSDWRNYTWGFPILGAIFAIISIVTPVMDTATLYDHFLDDTYHWDIEIWMVGYWEFFSYDGWVDELANESGILFDISLTPFIICFLGLLIGAISGIGAGVSGYRGDFRKNIAAISGILMIGFTLIFIIWVEVEWSPFSGDSVLDEWDDLIDYQFDPGFGVIGPFIGGIFCLVGALIPPEERAMPSASKQPGVEPASNLKFCPDCGAEATGKFCSNCGKSIVR